MGNVLEKAKQAARPSRERPTWHFRDLKAFSGMELATRRPMLVYRKGSVCLK
jgi:hypothetical protein